MTRLAHPAHPHHRPAPRRARLVRLVHGAWAPALLLAAAMALASTSVQAGPDAQVVRRSRPMYGTVVEILAVPPAAPAGQEPAVAELPFEAAFDEVRRIELLVDDEDPQAPIARLNAAAGQGPVVVEPELFALLGEVQRLARLTKGAFDVTTPVFDEAQADVNRAPTEDPMEARSSTRDGKGDKKDKKKGDKDKDKDKEPEASFDDLVLDAARSTAQLKSKGARVSLHMVGRAYALDRAARVLEDKGVKSFILSAGGDLVVRGKKGERPWMVGLQDPRAPGHFAALAAPGNAAVVTTGDFEEFFFDGGVRYHNVIDPRTGQPATRSRSVTVVAKDALSAEGLSRAVFVLGAKDGVVLLERLKDTSGVVVTADNHVVVTSGLKAALQLRPPTDGP